MPFDFTPPPVPAKPKAPLSFSDLLLRAADIIEQRGWVQGRLEDNRGRHCVAGAMLVARFGSIHIGEAERNIFRPYIERVCVELRQDVARWNDTTGRTADEIVHTLRSIALGRLSASMDRLRSGRMTGKNPVLRIWEDPITDHRAHDGDTPAGVFQSGGEQGNSVLESRPVRRAGRQAQVRVGLDGAAVNVLKLVGVD